MSGLPVRYLGWTTADLLRARGIWMLVVIAAAVFIQFGVNGASVLGVGRASIFLTLLATSRIVSGDIANGYHRTLFARPVTPAAYYLQRWLVGGAVVMAGALIVDYGLAAWLSSLPTGTLLLARTGALYLLVGGLVFALSTITRFDWIAAAVIQLVQGIVALARDGHLWTGALSRFLFAVLPPFHVLGIGGQPTSTAGLVHASLYGLALVVAATVMLVSRPLGAGSRG